MGFTAAITIGVGILCGGAAGAEDKEKPKVLDKPLSVQVTLDSNKQILGGSLIAYDAQKFVMSVNGKKYLVRWSDLVPGSQYAVRTQLIDKKNPADWLELADVAMKLELREQAKVAVAAAVKLDPSVKAKGDAILRSNPPSTQGVKYRKVTEEEHAKAIEDARVEAKRVGDLLHEKLEEVQSSHFIIFTDVPASNREFLTKNCEDAYAAVSKQFDIPVSENVFVGKLPVYMWNRRSDFERYGVIVDLIPTATISTFEGYFRGQGDGYGHMAMAWPDAERNPKNSVELWKYTLTHEFTHAFVSRYRTNRAIPRWLNEGLAEWIAFSRFPKKGVHDFARRKAGEDFDFRSLFDDKKYPGGDMYPVMQTMVEALIKEDRKAFIQMFNDIKDGMLAEDALWKNFRAGYRDWEPAWRKYASNLK